MASLDKAVNNLREIVSDEFSHISAIPPTWSFQGPPSFIVSPDKAYGVASSQHPHLSDLSSEVTSSISPNPCLEPLLLGPVSI